MTHTDARDAELLVNGIKKLKHVQADIDHNIWIFQYEPTRPVADGYTKLKSYNNALINLRAHVRQYIDATIDEYERLLKSI